MRVLIVGLGGEGRVKWIFDVCGGGVLVWEVLGFLGGLFSWSVALRLLLGSRQGDKS